MQDRRDFPQACLRRVVAIPASFVYNKHDFTMQKREDEGVKANYHTHTTRCQHAEGTDEAYVLAAIEAGFDVLGFADHAPWPFGRGFVSGIRMRCDQLPGYLASLQVLQAQYAGRLELHIGLEAEYFPRYHDHLLRMRDEGVTYFILGQHYADSEEENMYVGMECRWDAGVMRYAEAVVKGIRSGLYSYVAHPDLYMRSRPAFDKVCMRAADMICQAAREAGLPLEYNLLGLASQLQGDGRGYPHRDFWRYARKWDNDVILGVDAHAPSHLTRSDLWERGRQNVLALGYRLVDHLEMEA